MPWGTSPSLAAAAASPSLHPDAPRRSTEDVSAFERPAEITDTTTCAEWMELPVEVRDEYAMYRLAAMRDRDGLDPRDRPPQASEGSLLRAHMEGQCRQEPTDAAAIFRVAHDQYTILYERRVLLD